MSEDSCETTSSPSPEPQSSESSSSSIGASETSRNKNARGNSSVRRAKRRTPDDHDDENLIEQAMSMMNVDEFDTFGQFIANEMRQIDDLSIRARVKREIMMVFLNSSQPYPQQHGPSVIYPPNYSSGYSANNMQQFDYRNNTPYSNHVQTAPPPNAQYSSNYEYNNGTNNQQSLISTHTRSETTGTQPSQLFNPINALETYTNL